jgi:hypothetical protein
MVPGVAGMGGVLFGPRGNMEITYTWNLGRATNTRLTYALLQELRPMPCSKSSH